MEGSMHISDLITDPAAIRAGRINIIEANVSAGKTWFARNTLPKWTGNPERILYLIDTSNGEAYLLRNEIMVSRQTYAFCDYNTKHAWGEDEADQKMPVMTYSGFGSEIRRNRGRFNILDFDYIVCDEMQNLVNYRHYDEGPNENLIAAEVALQMIAAAGKVKIIGMSATPKKIREYFGSLCRDVPFDRSDLVQLETFACIPYSSRLEDIILREKGKTGIVFTVNVADMKHIIDFANRHGVRANGFWSTSDDTQRKDPMNSAQFALRDVVLRQETLPTDLDLLVINMASETCIKIDGKKRKVDYMAVHNSNKEIQTQVRGRYHGDLPTFYYHDVAAANLYACRHLPVKYLNVRLYADERKELCDFLDLRKPNDPYNGHYMWPKVMECLQACGYDMQGRKDSGRNGKWYYVVRRKCTNSGEPL